MIMEILTGSGGILSYLQDILGGFCPRQQKRVGGILSGGDFVLHSIKSHDFNIYNFVQACGLFKYTFCMAELRLMFKK